MADQKDQVPPQGQQPNNPELTMNIPDHFIKLGCLAFTCANCDFPSCFGWKTSGTCLCLDGYHVCCKPIEHETACCLLAGSDCELISPVGLCKIYKQIFCFECFCAIPSVDEGYRATPVAFVAMPNTHDGKSQMNDVQICGAWCCVIDSCNCNFPSCLGCYRKGVCLCIDQEMMCYKFMCWDENRSRPETLCILSKGNCALVAPYTCCKLIDQCCCIDRRAACPCDDDVPCVWGYLPFCVCCVDYECKIQCCMTINDVYTMKQMKNGGMQQGGVVVAQQPGGGGYQQQQTMQPVVQGQPGAQY